MQNRINTSTADYWRDAMNEEIARRVLGSGHFDYAVERGTAYCASRAAGAWQATFPESFGAYKCAQQAASARASAIRTFRITGEGI